MVSAREEPFQDVGLMVKGFDTIGESLEAVVTFETLDGDNRYFCDHCKEKRDASRGIIFRSLPPVLIFSLSRFEFDMQEEKRKKVTSVFR